MLSKIHHVGLVVRSLDEAYGFWRDTLGLRVQKEATVRDQGVKAALLPCGETEIELLEPIDSSGGVAKFLEKRGEGLHHLCFESDDVGKDLDAAKATGLPMIDEAPRPGLAGMIGFLHPKASCGILVEYATPPGDAHPAHGGDLSFDHLAMVVDDAKAAAETFSKNFGFRPTLETAAAGPPVNIAVSQAFLRFFTAADAPGELATAKGLAAIGLRARRLDTLTERLGSAIVNTTAGKQAHANGVPIALLQAPA